jgi:hypothetical protein
MSAAALTQWLRSGPVPGTDGAAWNGWNGRATPVPFLPKQAAPEGETPDGTDGTGGTGVLAGVGKQSTESRPDQAANDPQALPDWRQADADYLRHHFACPACCAAGHGRGARCGTGSELWATYEAAMSAEPMFKTTRRNAQ